MDKITKNHQFVLFFPFTLKCFNPKKNQIKKQKPRTNIFITSRMDTVGQTVNQIPIMVKTSSITPQQNPSQTLQLTPVATQNIQALPQPIPQSQQQTAAQTISKPQPVQPGQTIQPGQSVTLKVPVPVSVANHGLVSNSPADMNKFFNEMKNSKKPYLTIKMKSPKKSMLSEALDLFTNNERYLKKKYLCHLYKIEERHHFHHQIKS